MDRYPPGAIFCKTCGYCLYALTVNRCPECGKGFDPANPKTFRRQPRRMWPRRLLAWGGLLLLVLSVTYGAFLVWLYVGWRSEAGARGLVTGPNDGIETRSILPPALARLLVGECREWQERVDCLTVRSHPLSSNQICAIGACRHLHELALCEVPLTVEDMVRLCQCRELKRLCLSDAGLHGEDLAPVSGLGHLEELDLYPNPELDDAALPAIGKLKELQRLHLNHTAVTGQGLTYLSELGKLEELELGDCGKLTDAALPSIAKLRQLKSLLLSGTAITDGGLAPLAQLPKLQELMAQDCRNLTNAAVPALSRLTGLKTLDLWYTRLTPKGIKKLQGALPKCHVPDANESSCSPDMVFAVDPLEVDCDPEEIVWVFMERMAGQSLIEPTTRPTKELTLDLGNKLSLKLVLIPAGRFTMGSREFGERPPTPELRHRVTISKAFYMGVYPVTWEQYAAVMGKGPSTVRWAPCPVEGVSWNEATEFCKKLSTKTGKTVRLPTEAEWEYACRAGSRARFCFGDDAAKLGDYAWYGYNQNVDGLTHPVGQKKPNAWGLYDMHGNVSQWCLDWWGMYPDSAVTDPTGPAEGSSRVVRGGSWISPPDTCRSAYRASRQPDVGDDFTGFRVVVVAD